jgi:hypothetical protein
LHQKTCWLAHPSQSIMLLSVGFQSISSHIIHAIGTWKDQNFWTSKNFTPIKVGAKSSWQGYGSVFIFTMFYEPMTSTWKD